MQQNSSGLNPPVPRRLKTPTWHDPRRWWGALAAGMTGIAANVAVLWVGTGLGLRSESGGLLRLLLKTLGGWVPVLAHHPPPTALAWLGFHVGSGLGMVVVYVAWLDRALPGPAWWRGFLFGLLPWGLNSFLVLPLLGQGLAGHRVLTPAGMAWFFLANQVFAVVTATLYARLTREPGPA